MISFQPFETEHLGQAARIYADCFNAPPWNDGWTVGAALKRLKTLLDFPNAFGLVAIRSEALLGLALGHCEPWSDGLHFYLNELCIDPVAQRQRIGRALLDELLRRLRRQGIGSVFLLTEESSAAEAFFIEQGFEVDTSSAKLWKKV